MRNIVFHPQGWEDFTYWATADKKMLRRLVRLIEEARQTPFEGTGNRNRCAVTCPDSPPGGSMMSTASFTARPTMS